MCHGIVKAVLNALDFHPGILIIKIVYCIVYLPKEDIMFLIIISFSALIILVGLTGWISVQIRWGLIMLLMVVFLAMIGKRVTGQKVDGKLTGGRWTGILIDNRFKMSLSRFQIILWSILALSAFAVIALNRSIPVLTGEINALIPYLPASATQQPNTTPSQTGVNATPADVPPAPFDPLNIAFPEELLIAMGISTLSLAGASFINSNKSEVQSSKVTSLLDNQRKQANDKVEQAKKGVATARAALTALEDELKVKKAILKDHPEDAEAQLKIDQLENDSLPTAKAVMEADTVLDAARKESTDIEDGVKNSKGDIQTNDSLDQADMSDMFRGELVSNFRVVDVTKVQMFFFTILLIFTYGTLMWGLLASPTLQTVARVTLPPFSASLVGLLGISHAGYLVVKQTGG
jgi:hypothetical protein